MAITQLSLGKHGRLGNQLFQYAALKYISLRNTTPLVLPPPSEHRLRDFRVCVHYAPTQQLVSNRWNQYNEPFFHFNPDVWKAPDNTNYHGYFQSEKYFKDIRHVLQKEFRLVDENITKAATEKIKEIREKHPDKDLVAFHIRRGDNVPADKNHAAPDGAQYKVNKQDFHPLLSKEYIDYCLKKFEKDIKLIFSDSIKDIGWCRENLEGENFYFVGGANDLYDFEMMKLCDHNAISNSSFSWWAAWLNENPDKKIVAPSNWFGKVYARHNLKDLIPEGWETY